MHLPDRRRGHRVFVEFGEEFIHRALQFRLDNFADGRRRIGRRISLKLLQFLAEGHADEIGAGAEEFAPA